MKPRHQELSLAEGMRRLHVSARDLWVGVAGLGGNLTEFEIEAYVTGALDPDQYSHNLIAQALNEVSVADHNDHPVAYAKGDEMTTQPTGAASEQLLAPTFADAFADLDPQVWSNLHRLGRALHVQNGALQETLDAILRSTRQVVPRSDSAGLNLYVKGRFEPQAVLGEAPHELDLVQQSSGVGPCIDASRDQKVVAVADMRNESRWPEFCAKANELGVSSMVCVPLWVDDLRLGSLSLYSAELDSFDEQSLNLAGLFATHAALALADARHVENLQQALTNRDVIGQAKGILMATQHVTADQAFERLSAASQALNLKLVRIAELVSMTGELPAA